MASIIGALLVAVGAWVMQERFRFMLGLSDHLDALDRRVTTLEAQHSPPPHGHVSRSPGAVASRAPTPPAATAN